MFYRSAAKTNRVEAKVLARKLVVLLSTRVSVIVIVMVMVRLAVVKQPVCLPQPSLIQRSSRLLVS